MKEGLVGGLEGAGGGKDKRQRRLRWKYDGVKKIITRGEGLIWLLPQESTEELTWRKEQRRRKLLERWEAPPPGPPEAEEREKGYGSGEGGEWKQDRLYMRRNDDRKREERGEDRVESREGG